MISENNMDIFNLFIELSLLILSWVLTKSLVCFFINPSIDKVVNSSIPRSLPDLHFACYFTFFPTSPLVLNRVTLSVEMQIL